VHGFVLSMLIGVVPEPLWPCQVQDQLKVPVIAAFGLAPLL
jgi:hypothetical protein